MLIEYKYEDFTIRAYDKNKMFIAEDIINAIGFPDAVAELQFIDDTYADAEEYTLADGRTVTAITRTRVDDLLHQGENIEFKFWFYGVFPSKDFIKLIYNAIVEADKIVEVLGLTGEVKSQAREKLVEYKLGFPPSGLSSD